MHGCGCFIASGKRLCKFGVITHSLLLHPFTRELKQLSRVCLLYINQQRLQSDLKRSQQNPKKIICLESYNGTGLFVDGCVLVSSFHTAKVQHVCFLSSRTSVGGGVNIFYYLFCYLRFDDNRKFHLFGHNQIVAQLCGK